MSVAFYRSVPSWIITSWRSLKFLSPFGVKEWCLLCGTMGGYVRAVDELSWKGAYLIACLKLGSNPSTALKK